jgi:glutathionylspermidine synthase
MTKDVMAQVASCSNPREVWTLLEQTYASRSKARVVNTRMALATTQKGNMTIFEYIAKMKSLANEMVSTRKALEDEELVSYIMAGLDFDYNHIVSAMVARVKPISVGELYAQLLSFEARWELTQGGQQASMNVARHGRGGGPGPNNRGRGRGRGGDHGGGRGGFSVGAS